VDSSEVTPDPQALQGPDDYDTPVSAEFTRVSECAISAAPARSSDRKVAGSARRAGNHDFLTDLASPDAGEFGMPGMRKEVGERGLPA
jgi:hypothetical protein